MKNISFHVAVKLLMEQKLAVLIVTTTYRHGISKRKSSNNYVRVFGNVKEVKHKKCPLNGWVDGFRELSRSSRLFFAGKKTSLWSRVELVATSKRLRVLAETKREAVEKVRYTVDTLPQVCCS